MKTYKSFAFIFSILMAVVLLTTACGLAPRQTTRIAVVMPSTTNDNAFSQSMYTALQAVQAEMGGESALTIKYSENRFNVSDAEKVIRDYANQGFDVVIAHGSQYGPLIKAIAKDFPKTAFAWGTEVNTFGQPNVYAYTALAEQGGYVNGVLAAHLATAKFIGVTGPVNVGDAKAYVDGFVQGVASVDSSINVSTIWTGSFSDTNLMAIAARSHISKGANILTGSSQSVVGAIDIARNNGKVLWFATQADQSSLAPSLVVASQVYDWTTMIKEIISNHNSGVLGGKTYTLTLKNGGLKIVYNPGYALPADVKAAGDKAIEDIKNGTILVSP